MIYLIEAVICLLAGFAGGFLLKAKLVALAEKAKEEVKTVISKI